MAWAALGAAVEFQFIFAGLLLITVLLGMLPSPTARKLGLAAGLRIFLVIILIVIILIMIFVEVVY